MHYVKQFDINGVATRQVACIELHGKPNAATEGCVGVLAVDIDSPTHDVYKCVAVNGSIYTWELLSSGLSIMSTTLKGGGEEIVHFPYENLRTPEMYMIKVGDLILDKDGYLYQISALDSTYCVAKYCGTRIATDKSAYNYAKEGGYTGTEAEFSAKLAADIPTTVSLGYTNSSLAYFKISDFGAWGNGEWYRKGFSMLITSRAGELVWVAVSSDDSNTNAKAIRLLNTYSKIAHVYYSVSESAVYVAANPWCNNINAHILSNVYGDYVPTVQAASALASDAVEITITEFGAGNGSTNIGDSTRTLNMTGSGNRPTYNDSEMALHSDLPTKPSDVGASPTGHKHTKSEITDFPTSMPASDVHAWAKASTKPAYGAAEVGAVPTSRTVNGKALSSNITLGASDVGADPSGSATGVQNNLNSHTGNKSNPHGVTAAQAGAVPTTRKVNNKALSADISLGASDVGAVPTSRTVNGKALGGDITLSYSDVGAKSASEKDVLIAEYGVTTYAEIDAAYNAGKAIFLKGVVSPGLGITGPLVPLWTRGADKYGFCMYHPDENVLLSLRWECDVSSSGGWSAISEDFLGAGNIITGKYTGTGTYGSSNPSVLSFSKCAPTIVFILTPGGFVNILSAGSYGASLGSYSKDITVTSKVVAATGATGTVTITKGVQANNLQWYADSAALQLNETGVEYKWVAIGVF